MLVKNIYHKRLSFMIEERTVGIESNQIITVSDETGIEMLKSPWITDNLAGQCSECSQKEQVIESIKTPEVPKIEKIPEIKEIKKEKIEIPQRNDFGKIIKKKIESKKVEEENN